MSRRGLLAMGSAEDADHAQPAPPRSFGHLHDYFPNAAGGDHDHNVMGPEGEIPQNLFSITRRLFQVQTLAQAVGPNDGIVVRQSQLDDGVPTDRASLALRHFFAHHSAVTAAEQMNQA